MKDLRIGICLLIVERRVRVFAKKTARDVYVLLQILINLRKRIDKIQSTRTMQSDWQGSSTVAIGID